MAAQARQTMLSAASWKTALVGLIAVALIAVGWAGRPTPDRGLGVIPVSFLTALAGGDTDQILASDRLVVSGSPAAAFVDIASQTVASLSSAGVELPTDVSVQEIPGGLRVCADVAPCSDFTRFDLARDGRVRSFVVDGIPVEEIVGDDEATAGEDDGSTTETVPSTGMPDQTTSTSVPVDTTGVPTDPTVPVPPWPVSTTATAPRGSASTTTTAPAEATTAPAEPPAAETTLPTSPPATVVVPGSTTTTRPPTTPTTTTAVPTTAAPVTTSTPALPAAPGSGPIPVPALSTDTAAPIRRAAVDTTDPGYTDGVIRHSIAVTLPSGLVQGQAVPRGTMVAIPQSVDITRLGLGPEALPVARALQDYGGYVVDWTSDSVMGLQAEASIPPSWWAGVTGPTWTGQQLAVIRSQLQVAASYGPRAGLPARRDVGALRVTSPGTVIENVDATSIVIEADDVTVRNCRVIGSNRGGALLEFGSSKNVVIEDCYFDGSVNGAPGAYQAIHGWGGNSTVRRVYGTGVANGVELGGSGLVEQCYFEDLWLVPGTTQHADGIQADGGGPYVIRNNMVLMGFPPDGIWWQTSAIGMWAVLSDLHDVTVTNNVIGPLGGYLFYNGVTSSGYMATNIRVDNNVILRRPRDGEYGLWFNSEEFPMRGTHTGNIYADGSSAD